MKNSLLKYVVMNEVKKLWQQHHLLKTDVDNVNEFAIDLEWKKAKTRQAFKKWLIVECLKQYDCICWGSKEDCMDFAKGYLECNGRKFDKFNAEQNVEYFDCGIYALFEYDNYYLDD